MLGQGQPPPRFSRRHVIIAGLVGLVAVAGSSLTWVALSQRMPAQVTSMATSSSGSPGETPVSTRPLFRRQLPSLLIKGILTML
jgi:hypothetical protein